MGDRSKKNDLDVVVNKLRRKLSRLLFCEVGAITKQISRVGESAASVVAVALVAVFNEAGLGERLIFLSLSLSNFPRSGRENP